MKTNQLKAGAALSYVMIIVSNLISLIYTPVMLRVMGQSEYGLYGYVSGFASNLSILSFGFGSAYVRNYAKYKKNQDEEGLAGLNGLFITVFCGIGLFALLVGCGLCTFSDAIFGEKLTVDELGKAKILLFLMVLNIVVSFPFSVFNSYVTASQQFLYQRLSRIIQKILVPCVTLPLLYMGFGAVGVTVVTLLMTVALGIADIIAAMGKFRMRISFKNCDFGLMREIVPFTFFVFLNMIVEQINWSIDRFIIGRFYGTALVAVYNIGALINAYYREFSTAISSVFTPRINNLVVSESNNMELTQLMTKVGRIQFMFLSLVLSGFFFLGQFFIEKWAGEGYENAYYVALILMVPVTIPLCQNIAIEVQRAKNKHQFRAVLYLFMALLNLGMTLYLCPRYGIIGSAAATAFVTVVGNGFIINWFYHCKLGLDMGYYWKDVLKILPAFILPILAGIGMNYVIDTTNMLIFVVKGVIYVAVYMVSLWFFAMNDYEKGLIGGAFRKLRRKA